jgi:hypothetical protein
MQQGMSDIRGENLLKYKIRKTGWRGNSNKQNYVGYKHHHLIMTTDAHISRQLVKKIN